MTVNVHPEPVHYYNPDYHKPTRTPTPLRESPSYVFVLWGERFEKPIATLCIARLRKAGLTVKIVGLRSHSSIGTHGIALVPELPLQDALLQASRAACIIVPCTSPYVGHIDNDPRVRRLFAAAQANGARFVTGLATTEDLAVFPVPVHQVTVCWDHEEWMAVVDELALALRDNTLRGGKMASEGSRVAHTYP